MHVIVWAVKQLFDRNLDHSSAALGSEKSDSISEVTYALDDFCDSVGSMVARNREFVHARRIHPPAAGPGGRSPAHQLDHRT